MAAEVEFHEVKLDRDEDDPESDEDRLNVSLESDRLGAEQKAAHEADTLPMDSAHSQSEEERPSGSAGCLRTAYEKVHKFMLPVLLSNSGPSDPDAALFEKAKRALLCPPHGVVAEWLTRVLLVLALWGCAFAVLGEVAAPPSGSLFWVVVLVGFALVLGRLVSYARLPPLLGMLLAGIVTKNIPGVHFDTHWASISFTLRGVALVVILMRAGLGLDPVALKKLSGMVLRLAFTPCLVETATVAVTAHFLLNMPWLWGFMMGFVLAAVSPAVVVPCLLSIQEKGYGVDKGIPTLVIAAASVDDVLAISGFTIILGITFNSDQNLAMAILQGPKEALIGLLWGVTWGVLCILFPNKDDQNVASQRFCALFSGGVLALFGSQSAGVPGAGALAVLTMAFVAGVGWRRQGWDDDENNPVSVSFGCIWFVFQPVLFVLIGTEIRISDLEASVVGWGLCVLFVGLAFRVVTTFFVVMGGDLALKERLFVALAWLPKATVQAAIGPLALDNASRLSRDDPRYEKANDLGLTVLTVAVLSILVTAPVGSAAIMTTHSFLLSRRAKKGEQERNDAENQPQT